MTSTAAILEQVSSLLADACGSVDVAQQFDGVSAHGLLELLQSAGRAQRHLDAVITILSAGVQDRDQRLSDEQVSPRAGCRDLTELLRRTLRIDTGTARRYAAAARAVHRDVQLSTGESLPARFEALGAALCDGKLSVAGLLAATGPLEAVASRIGAADLTAADRTLAEAARGLDLADDAGRPGPAPTTDELAALANHIVLLLDPDGKEPEDQVAMRKRGLTLGRIRDGLVPVTGGLLPDVAGQLQRLLDALLNPRTDEPSSPTDSADVVFRVEGSDPPEPDDPDELPDPPDPRTPMQKRHDAFASVLTTAAASGVFPTLGGSAPTLVVSVTAADYTQGAGRATVEGTGWDIPLTAAHQTACAGGIQRVLFDEHERIVSIGTTARIFNATQRRAIALRDRECVIPGCLIPSTWCEIHHVIEHARGGPTHTSNGVALCWWHHRTLDTSGWHIRMQQGVPEIRGPAWWDPHGGWHRPRNHRQPCGALAAALGPRAGHDVLSTGESASDTLWRRVGGLPPAPAARIMRPKPSPLGV